MANACPDTDFPILHTGFYTFLLLKLWEFHYAAMVDLLLKATIMWSLFHLMEHQGNISILITCMYITTVFVDTRLWKTKRSRKRFQKFPSIIRVIDMSDRNPPITATSVTFYVMLVGCDWWISIRHVDNTYDWRKFLETFPQVFCFPKSRINENGGNMYRYFRHYLDGFGSFHGLLRRNSHFTLTKKLLHKEGDVTASNWDVLYTTANDITLSLKKVQNRLKQWARTLDKKGSLWSTWYTNDGINSRNILDFLCEMHSKFNLTAI